MIDLLAAQIHTVRRLAACRSLQAKNAKAAADFLAEMEGGKFSWVSH